MAQKIIVVEKRNVYGRELIYPVTFKKQIEVLTGKQTLDATDIRALTEMGFVVRTLGQYVSGVLESFNN